MLYRLDIYFVIIALFISFVFYEPDVRASQRAVVIAKITYLYLHPTLGAQKIASLSQHTQIFASSKMVKDSEENYWYKVLSPSGKFGYVLANDLRTQETVRDLASVGIGKIASEDESNIAHQDKPWCFVLRGMALGGYQSSQFVFSPEAEGTFCIPFESHGYLHRIFSIGAAIIPFSGNTIFAGSFVGRLFLNSRIEPELRVRLGRSLGTDSFVAGLNVGLNYPFSLNYRHFWAGYLELGSIASLADSAQITVWGAAGLGFHF